MKLQFRAFLDKHKKTLKIFGLILAIGLSISIFFLREQLALLKGYGYLGIFMISVLGNATIIIPVPVVLTAYLGGGIFNPVLVGTIAAFGATIGELTGYMAGVGGRSIIKNPKIFLKVERWMKQYGLLTIFILAAIPNPFFDLAGIASGMMKISVKEYFLTTWAGKIVKFIFFAFLGSGSFELFGSLV
jgi:uncharacterized membrane protein YdjX (TVP38/TMEM64 family)